MFNKVLMVLDQHNLLETQFELPSEYSNAYVPVLFIYMSEEMESKHAHLI